MLWQKLVWSLCIGLYAYLSINQSSIHSFIRLMHLFQKQIHIDLFCVAIDSNISTTGKQRNAELPRWSVSLLCWASYLSIFERIKLTKTVSIVLLPSYTIACGKMILINTETTSYKPSGFHLIFAINSPYFCIKYEFQIVSSDFIKSSSFSTDAGLQPLPPLFYDIALSMALCFTSAHVFTIRCLNSSTSRINWL